MPDDARLARDRRLNADVPAGGRGFPLHPDLQGLRYPNYGVHRRPLAERQAYEEDMLDWVAMGRAHGLTPGQSMHLSLYL
jgi:hypothetical protein